PGPRRCYHVARHDVWNASVLEEAVCRCGLSRRAIRKRFGTRVALHRSRNRQTLRPCKWIFLPKRWIVERTIAWLNRCRRLAKDWENLNGKALAFLRLASIRLMLRRLCNPA